MSEHWAFLKQWAITENLNGKEQEACKTLQQNPFLEANSCSAS
jgi:hypothetical protein